MTELSAPAVRNENGKGIALLAAQIVPVMAIVSLFPAIPKLFQQFGGIAHANLLVPMILTIPALMVALTAPIAGALADRFGRRPSFLTGMFLYTAMGLVPIFTANIAVIVASRAILGIAEAIAVTVSSALIGDYFGERRQKWTSWVGIVISPAGTLMLVAGGLLAEWDWRGPFYIYLLTIPILVLALIYIDEPQQSRAALSVTNRLPFPWRASMAIGALTLVASLIYYVEPLNIARVLTGIRITSPAIAGIVQAITTSGYVIGALVYRRISGRPVADHMAISWLFMGLGMVVIGLSGTLFGVGLGAVIQQIGAGFTIPALLSWGQARLPFEQRARGMGIWTTAFFIGTFLCPPILTGVEQLTGGLPPAIAVLGFVSLAAALAAMWAGRRYARSPAGAFPTSIEA
ncbi:MAG: MFS transporter [Novosphingobium sp.]